MVRVFIYRKKHNWKHGQRSFSSNRSFWALNHIEQSISTWTKIVFAQFLQVCKNKSQRKQPGPIQTKDITSADGGDLSISFLFLPPPAASQVTGPFALEKWLLLLFVLIRLHAVCLSCRCWSELIAHFVDRLPVCHMKAWWKKNVVYPGLMFDMWYVNVCSGLYHYNIHEKFKANNQAA